MDVILHLGAHRTGTATFQGYMRRHAKALAAQRVVFWGPRRARHGIYSGDLSENRSSRAAFRRAQVRVGRLLDQAAARGVQTVVVSDTNMIGTIEDNLAHGALYPCVADRLAQFAKPFKGHVTGVMLSPRSLEVYWCSVLAQGVAQGHDVPSRQKLHDLAVASRSWRDVVTDVAAALPGVPLRVLPFETYKGRPDALLAQATGIDAPCDTRRAWLNPSPKLPELRRAASDRGASPAALPFGMGRWNPFTNEEHAILREMHADDMMWLTSGADGLATLTEDCLRHRAGHTPPHGAQAKGQRDELEERHMARPGRR